MKNRRSLLYSLGVAGIGTFLGTSTQRAFAAVDPLIFVRRSTAAALPAVPEDFLGLGYEMSSVALPGLLSVANQRYVQMLSNLGNKGVLRVGGIVSEYTQYEPEGTIAAQAKNTVITRASLEQFAAFLRKTGWTAIWSVNFGHGTLEQAIAEAKDVARILGSSLQALEIGNEVENYSRGDNPLRTPPYAYETYRAEYRKWHDALKAAVPGLRFAGPDTAVSVEWVERMAADAHGDVQLLTTHYYRNHQTHGSADQVTYPDLELKKKLERLARASQTSGIPWRMCETNSFSGGGLPGVSNTLLGALWTLDFLLLLASYRCAGVNIETGVNHLGFISSYSPIQDDGHGINSAGAPYYGMLACAEAMRDAREILPIDLNAGGINVTAYLLGSAEKPRSLVLINRDKLNDATFSIHPLKMGVVTAHTLTGKSALSDEGVTFGGSSVNREGGWRPGFGQLVHNEKITIPKMSAAVLRTMR